MSAPLRVGLVGLGVIAPYYVAAFDRVDAAELVAVCDLRAERLRGLADTHACYTDHRAMLAEAGLDALIVNVPNDAHVEICADAVTANIAACVEKPLAIEVGAARELCAAARAAGVTLFTAFHRRYNDNVLNLRARGAAHGSVRSVVVHYDELIEEHVGEDRWYLDMERCGGGCVADNGPNALDTVRMFLPDLAVQDASIERDGAGVDRKADITLAGTDGATARVLLDWSYRHGERKTVEVEYGDGTVLFADMLGGHQGFKSSLWHEYVGILDDFVHAIHTGGTHGEDGLIALELVADSYARAGQDGPR
ncbi:Gfo/Idh/MocA family oxidoreductase [Nocardia sp. CDC159]|uniref:Gfo/Idh/MocA family oxidoreductase n=1 Tax=Nocardia pulmonis TaxID=2951408 RepID=A0A9X2E7L0_9NOCA|nr:MULTISPECIES: Gfo/Idh/MocA family oxidoreductase [Nocardia]MCM6773146.1 Gfo/Idh/MocA family oxidoreductase [Nocardia pulmonis]MCM6785551.1 Gfo/Idh/MocA family oxidoreductase [Nocardia sp. CDC159]